MGPFKKTSQEPARGSRVYKRTPVTTYYRSKSRTEDASPFRKKEPPKKRRKYLLGAADVFLLVLLVGAVIYSLLLSSKPAVSATSLAYRPLKTYQAGVEASFKGFQNRSKVTFNENKSVQKIQSQFPEVQNAIIELPFFSQQAKVRLVISPPAFKLSSGGQLYVIDSQGTAIAKAQDLSASKKLVTVDDQSGFETALGKQVLSTQSVSFIGDLITQCRRASVPISSLTLPALPQELDLRTADQPYYVKFYLGGSADLETGQFLASRQKFAQSRITPGEYLDVRVSGKVFYK